MNHIRKSFMFITTKISKRSKIMNRRTAREKAMQILFQLDMNEQHITESLEHFIDDQPKNPYLTTLVEGVSKHIAHIDQTIHNNLEHWSLDRVATVEKTLLRIATFEIKYLDDIPEHVSINEAVELAKKYGEEKSGSFVNGVLSKLI